MKHTFLISLIILVFFSCSPDEETQAPTNTVQTTTPEPETVAVQYTLTVAGVEGGTVTNGGTFDQGTEVTITALATEGYVFSGWTGSTETSNVISITLSADITLTANFELIEPNV